MVGICLQFFDFSHKEIFKSVSKRNVLPYKVLKIKQWVQPLLWSCPLPKTNKNKNNMKQKKLFLRVVVNYVINCLYVFYPEPCGFFLCPG